MKKLLFLILTFYLLVVGPGCVHIQDPFPALPPGIWRGELELESIPISNQEEATQGRSGLTFQELAQGKLPFQFEVVYDEKDDFHLEIINGEERIIVDDIYFGPDRRTAKDTLLIEFPVFDTYIKAIYEERFLSGEWVVNYKENYSIPFKAFYGQNYRFTRLQKEPKMDVSGRWAVQFDAQTEDPYPAIGEFQQNGNHLTGTFLTETGDYRFLEGTIQDNKMYLSCFDGSHAFLFEAKIQDDSTLIGSFKSGTHYESVWTAKRSDDFSLTDPHKITQSESDEFNFSFPTPDGDTISLDDPKFEGKVVIIQIMATWCPNCRDETNFLLEYLDKNATDNLAILGVAFERYRDQPKAMQTIQRYREKMGISYPIAWGGYYDKKEASKQFPRLNGVFSYPTMIILDKQQNIRKIHTGFSGPATSEYQLFKENFNSLLDSLTNE